MLDGPDDTAGVEELEDKVDGGALPLVNVRHTTVPPAGQRTLTSARLVWGLSGAFLGVYVIVQDLNIPLIVQPQSFGVLSLFSWAQVSTLSRLPCVCANACYACRPSVCIMGKAAPFGRVPPPSSWLFLSRLGSRQVWCLPLE